jgi:hypothetical protein
LRDEEEGDDVVDATPSIKQFSTWSSSDLCVGGEEATTLWVEAGTNDDAPVACPNDGSTLVGLFILVFIFNTPALIAPGAPFCLAAVTFDAIAPLTVPDAARAAPFIAAALGALAFGGAVDFDAAALDGAEAILGAAVAMTFGASPAFDAAIPFGVVAIFFIPATFFCFLAGQMQSSAFLFFAALVPGFGRGP